jgi:hypothetical protein
MRYILTYYYSGEEYTEEIDATLHSNLLTHVEELINEQTSDPDTCFKLTDEKGNVIATEENLK